MPQAGHEHHTRPAEHHGVERGTLSTSRRAASAASCGSSTSSKLLRSVKDVGPSRQLVDCSSILEGSAHTSHVSRAPCSQHVSGEIPSVQAVWRCAERQGRYACARRGESGALGLSAVDVGAGCRQRSSSSAPNVHLVVPLSLRVVGVGRRPIAGSMRLGEPHRTIYERQAVDGRRDADRYKTPRLRRNVRNSQIYATYVGTRPRIPPY